MRYETDQISFECVENSRGECDKEILRCNDAGLYLNLPGGGRRQISYNTSAKDEYFAPFLEIVNGTDELLWAYSMNSTKVDRASEVKATGIKIIKLKNPFWAAYPAWDTDDVEFQKFYQCQKRTLGKCMCMYMSLDVIFLPPSQ
jgi:hypothetical protein